MTATQAPNTERERKEQAALAKIVERLSRLFPELSEDEIRIAVHGKHTDFEDARIRDFVPVLVENVIRDELTHRVRHYRA